MNVGQGTSTCSGARPRTRRGRIHRRTAECTDKYHAVLERQYSFRAGLDNFQLDAVHSQRGTDRLPGNFKLQYAGQRLMDWFAGRLNHHRGVTFVLEYQADIGTSRETSVTSCAARIDCVPELSPLLSSMNSLLANLKSISPSRRSDRFRSVKENVKNLAGFPRRKYAT